MEIDIQLATTPIPDEVSAPASIGRHGAWLEFRGIVRNDENSEPISALEYEAYSPMAEKELRRILEMLGNKFPCLAAKVIHRTGIIPVGETAIYVGIAAAHRGEAISLLTEFMNRLKQDVPIWKRRALPIGLVGDEVTSLKSKRTEVARVASTKNFEDAISDINAHCQALPGVRTPLDQAFGRVLRENVSAPEDLPSVDKSTRDGFAILQNDCADVFTVVDTIHAADWKPRRLMPGEAVRIATGASLPCDGLQVVMQEYVERTADKIRIVKRDASLNIRKRGEEMRTGEILLRAGTRVDAGTLALLATVGCVNPLVSPKLRVIHFTTGDEIIAPGQKPKPGQIRDSNSILIRALLHRFPGQLTQMHLPENFDKACEVIMTRNLQPSAFDVLLISGGASVGEKDFTRELLEHLGFEIIFNRISIRPGAPLIFGVNGNRIAFGLPGNPLSHFVCFQLFVATALAKMIGVPSRPFLRGVLSTKLEDSSNPRETFWPARCDIKDNGWQLTPVRWSSSGDVTCLKDTNALIRVPANRGDMAADAEVEFLPIDQA